MALRHQADDPPAIGADHRPGQSGVACGDRLFRQGGVRVGEPFEFGEDREGIGDAQHRAALGHGNQGAFVGKAQGKHAIERPAGRRGKTGEPHGRALEVPAPETPGRVAKDRRLFGRTKHRGEDRAARHLGDRPGDVVGGEDLAVAVEQHHQAGLQSQAGDQHPAVRGKRQRLDAAALFAPARPAIGFGPVGQPGVARLPGADHLVLPAGEEPLPARVERQHVAGPGPPAGVEHHLRLIPAPAILHGDRCHQTQQGHEHWQENRHAEPRGRAGGVLVNFSRRSKGTGPNAGNRREEALFDKTRRELIRLVCGRSDPRETSPPVRRRPVSPPRRTTASGGRGSPRFARGSSARS